MLCFIDHMANHFIGCPPVLFPCSEVLGPRWYVGHLQVPDLLTKIGVVLIELW